MALTNLQKLLKAQEKRVRVAGGEPAIAPKFDRPTTSRYRCTECGEILRTLVACEQHEHRRVECVLVPEQSAH